MTTLHLLLAVDFGAACAAAFYAGWLFGRAVGHRAGKRTDHAHDRAEAVASRR